MEVVRDGDRRRAVRKEAGRNRGGKGKVGRDGGGQLEVSGILPCRAVPASALLVLLTGGNDVVTRAINVKGGDVDRSARKASVSLRSRRKACATVAHDHNPGKPRQHTDE